MACTVSCEKLTKTWACCGVKASGAQQRARRNNASGQRAHTHTPEAAMHNTPGRALYASTTLCNICAASTVDLKGERDREANHNGEGPELTPKSPPKVN